MNLSHVQTKSEIQQQLTSMGVHPRKQFGQHFLIDGNLMRKLADSAGIGSNDLIIEVGPGTGGLSDLLIARAKRLICVEIDRNMCKLLCDRFSTHESFTLIEGDCLSRKHEINRTLAAEIDSYLGNGAVKLVANLPYQAATPLVMNLLTDHPKVRLLCFSVQKEVADRLVAMPGGKDFGPLSILAKSICRVEMLAKLPPQAFWPQPKVDSALLRLTVTEAPLNDPGELKRFGAMLRATFDHRRKKLRKALAMATDGRFVESLESNHDLDRRPERVEPVEWLSIFQAFHAWKP